MEDGRLRNEEYQVESFIEDKESHFLWLVLNHYYGFTVSIESTEVCSFDYSEEREWYYQSSIETYSEGESNIDSIIILSFPQ